LVLKLFFAENYYYFEYYHSCKGLCLFLQGVPIFEDFNSKQDRGALQKYAKEFNSDKGIQIVFC